MLNLIYRYAIMVQMLSGDILGVLAVYLYVFILLLLTEKILPDDEFLNRKILHLGVGNILFILPLFDSRFAMAGLAAAPFILITFLISPYSPLKTVSKTSSKGHRLGLVYYAISWTLLALLFFKDPVIIAVGIAAMSFGDGFASLVGVKYGKRNYKVSGDKKSIEGSTAMFIFTVLTIAISLIYYGELSFHNLIMIPIVGLIATLVEGTAPKGID
ncbi:MAG: diacylglycerol/polyprenol kinase family protein, partial [Thermoplasmatota archaeon]